MEESDFKNGHPIDSDLITYKTDIHFLTNKSNNINNELFLKGNWSRLNYFQPFDWRNDYFEIPNNIYPTFPNEVSNSLPSLEILMFIKNFNQQTGNERVYFQGNLITKSFKDDKDKEYYVLSDNFDLMSLNNSPLKNYINVENYNTDYYIINIKEKRLLCDALGYKILNSINSININCKNIDDIFNELPEENLLQSYKDITDKIKNKELIPLALNKKKIIINKTDYNKGITITEKKDKKDTPYKNIILGIKFDFYPDGRISRLSEIYTTKLLYVYDTTRYRAFVDNEQKIVSEEFKNMNPNLISDIKFITDNPIGDFDYKSTKKIMVKGKKGYALSGIQYVPNSGGYWNKSGPRAINQIVFAFDSVYDVNAPTYYYHINNSSITELENNPLLNDINTYSYNMITHDKKIFISDFDVFYSYVPTEKNISSLEISSYIQSAIAIATALIAVTIASLATGPGSVIFALGAIANPMIWQSKWDLKYQHTGNYFAGIKGIMSVQSVSFDNNLVYDWIKNIDNIKCCDTLRDNLYDPETIEELYAKYIKEYYVSNTGMPSEKCINDILYPYCNSYRKIDYQIEIKNSYTKLKFQFDNKEVLLLSNDLKNNILNSINSILPSKIKCFDITNNNFIEYTIFTFIFSDSEINFNFKVIGININNESTTLNIDIVNDTKILEEERCKNFCNFSDIDCDNTIEKYCSNSKNDVSDAFGILDKDAYLVKKKIIYNPLEYSINLNTADTEIELYIPNKQTLFLSDERLICGCYFTKYKEYKQTLINFYNNIKSKYENELIKTNEQNIKNKINNEINNIEYLKKTLDLYDGEESFKQSLDITITDDNKNIMESYKSVCMFPSCSKSSYKLKNMKNINCTEKDYCIGHGTAVPKTNKDGTKIFCNLEKGDDEICVINEKGFLEPELALIPNIKNYKRCKDIYKDSIPYSDVERPSYCKISGRGRAIGCEGKYMKYVYDVIKPQFPDNREDLCPPPDDKLPLGYKKNDKRYDPINCGVIKEDKTTTNKIYLIIFFIILIISIIMILFIKKNK